MSADSFTLLGVTQKVGLEPQKNLLLSTPAFHPLPSPNLEVPDLSEALGQRGPPVSAACHLQVGLSGLQCPAQYLQTPVQQPLLVAQGRCLPPPHPVLPGLEASGQQLPAGDGQAGQGGGPAPQPQGAAVRAFLCDSLEISDKKVPEAGGCPPVTSPRSCCPSLPRAPVMPSRDSVEVPPLQVLCGSALSANL